MKKMSLLFACLLAMFGGTAFAAVDPAVSAAIATGTTDAQTIGAAILALVIIIAILRHIRAAK